jgi:hypothetical protein
MKTFCEFMSICEAYDADFMSGAQIRKTGEGGRIGTKRKKSEPERRRVKAVGGGKTEPVDYKPRKDIGSQRQASTRVQEPEQERGSADVKAKAAAAAKAERIAAARKRAAAKSSGETSSSAKPKAKEVAQQASKLLSKKKVAKPVSPDYKPAKASGYTDAERQKVTKSGERMLRGIMKQQELSKYEKETGQKATGKAKTVALGRATARMSQ